MSWKSQDNPKITYALRLIDKELMKKLNKSGIVNYQWRNRFEFYFERDFLEALLMYFDYGVLRFLSWKEFVLLEIKKIFEIEELTQYLNIFIYNILGEDLSNQIEPCYFKMVRYLFLRLLLVNETNFLGSVRRMLNDNPNSSSFYLRVNVEGDQIPSTNPFVLEVWNNQFVIYDEC